MNKNSQHEFRFTSQDGLQIACSRWQSCGAALGVMQIAHGLGEHSGRYSELIAVLQEAGFVVYANDYRAHGRTRYKTMTLITDEFMRRFLLHVLPSGFHRIRHYGLLANANRKTHIATARELLHQPAPIVAADPAALHTGTGSVRPTFVCRHCGAPMLVIETFARAQHIRGPPASPSPP